MASTFKQIGFEKILDMTWARSLTIPSGTTHVWLQAETKSLRMRRDDVPTPLLGALLIFGLEPLELPVDAVEGMKFIEIAGAGSAYLNVTYWGHG